MIPEFREDGRIFGTRISVYDIIPYFEGGRTSLDDIAKYNSLTVDELQMGLQYIDTYRDDVMRINRAIDERHARGNPPEVQAKLDEGSRRSRLFIEWVRKRRIEIEASGESFPPLNSLKDEYKRLTETGELQNPWSESGARNSGGHELRGTPATTALSA